MSIKDLIQDISERILNGGSITFEEAIKLINVEDEEVENLEALFEGANNIRKHFVGNKVDLCTILNAKSGKCSEDCKFCSQSSHYNTSVAEYSLLNYEDILYRAKEVEESGAHRFSLVTSGKGLCDEDFNKVVEIYMKLKNDTNLRLCASHGTITYEQAMRLKESGVEMYHHNVETSSNYYNEICTTHGYKERINTIKNVQKAGLEVCCGGILGLGEERAERVKMAFEIRDIGVESIPINILNPIKGTPLEDKLLLTPMEALKTMALYRYIIPTSYIRYAGGRIALGDKQNLGFKAGINAALVGNYLTTIGSDVETDKEMIRCEGLEI